VCEKCVWVSVSVCLHTHAGNDSASSSFHAGNSCESASNVDQTASRFAREREERRREGERQRNTYVNRKK
jgi:hypothetical protein